MSQLAAGQNPVFHETVPALSTSSVAHPDTWNPIHQALLDNDVVVKAAVDALDNALNQLDHRVDSVEATSSVALDRAMRLNWLYGSARMNLELFTDAWSLRDLAPVAVTSAIAGDDSIDLASTAGLIVGQEYVLFVGGTQEIVKISEILTANRARINGVLANTYGVGAKFARTNWGVDVGQATAPEGSVYFSKTLNLSAALGNHLVMIRRTTSPTLVRLYFTDAAHAAWTECPVVQQVATGVTDTGMADYLYNVPAAGDFQLKLVVLGGAINLKHLAAVTGKATTLGGYGIGDAYTKPEIDAAIAAVPKTRVVTLPTITGPSSVTPGTNITLTAASTSRLSGAVVSSFDFTKPDNTKQNVAAASGSALIALQVLGSIGDTRNVLVEAIDSEGNRSELKTHTLTITSNNAPSMAGFTHNVPASVLQATTATIQFNGATDADGDPVTYSIDAGASGLTFSKAAAIAANENITMTVPGSVLPSKSVSFIAYAVDNKGGQTPATISLTITGQSVWEFTTAGLTNWMAPESGRYEFVVVGGGGGGGAGGDTSYYNNHGQNGGVSSVGTLVSALGGYGGACGATNGLGDSHGGNGCSAGGGGLRPGSNTSYVTTRTLGKEGLGSGSAAYSSLGLTPQAGGKTVNNSVRGEGGYDGSSTQNLAEGADAGFFVGGGGGGVKISIKLAGDGLSNLMSGDHYERGLAGIGYAAGGGGGATQSGWGGGGGGSGYVNKVIATINGGVSMAITVGGGGVGGVRQHTYHGDGGAGASGYIRITYIGE